MNRTAEVFLAAREDILTNGLCRDQYDDGKSRCLIGAVARAAAPNDDVGDWVAAADPYRAELGAAIGVGICSIASYSDSAPRPEYVTDLLARAAGVADPPLYRLMLRWHGEADTYESCLTDGTGRGPRTWTGIRALWNDRMRRGTGATHSVVPA